MKDALALINNPAPFSVDDELLAELRKRIVREREQGLMLAILEDGVSCFLGYMSAKDERGKKIFAEAEAWILERDSEWLFSFENICETLGIDPDFLREGLIKRKAEGR